MPSAARVSDQHVCPTHPAGGPVASGSPTVMIGFMPAARVGDACVCEGAVDTITEGSSTVLIGHSPAARIGDNTAHGGTIVAGCPTVMIGG